MPTAKRDGKWESGEVIINRLCAAKYNLGFLNGFSHTADVQYFIWYLRSAGYLRFWYLAYYLHSNKSRKTDTFRGTTTDFCDTAANLRCFDKPSTSPLPQHGGLSLFCSTKHKMHRFCMGKHVTAHAQGHA